MQCQGQICLNVLTWRIVQIKDKTARLVHSNLDLHCLLKYSERRFKVEQFIKIESFQVFYFLIFLGGRKGVWIP